MVYARQGKRSCFTSCPAFALHCPCRFCLRCHLLLAGLGHSSGLRAAWRVGLFGFAASWVLAFILVLFSIAADSQPYAPLGKAVSVALIMLGVSVVLFYWGSVWYKNRNYFLG